MAEERAQSFYQKLGGRSGFLILRRVFMGNDHLLSVSTAVATERYKRLYFRDIEAFSIHRTDRAMWIALITGVLTLLSGGLVWALWPEGDDLLSFGAIFWSIVGGAGLVLFLWNLALGFSCTCFVRTAVQTVEISSLNRMRRALRTRALLVERISTAQPREAESPASVPVGGRTTVRIAGVPRPPAQAAPQTGESPKEPGNAIVFIGIGAILAWVAAAGVLLDYYSASPWALIVNVLLVLLALTGSITQITKSKGRGFPRAVTLAGFGVPVVTMVGAVCAYVVLVSSLVTGDVGTAANEHDMYFALAAVRPGESLVVTVCYLIVASGYAIAGLLGLIAWFRVAVSRRA